MKSAAVLGLYLPIAVFTAIAAWMMLVRLVWPLVIRKPDEVRENLIGLGAAGFALGVAIETPLYWAVRYLDMFDWLTESAVVVGTPKALYAASSVLLLSGLTRAITGRGYLKTLFALLLGLWAVGTLLSAQGGR